MEEISVIMPCHERGHDLWRILEAYDSQDSEASFEIIAVDDASADDTYRVLSNYRPRAYSLRIERQEVNRGPAAARNRAIRLAKAPLLLFVGDDILPEPDLVRRHLQIHRYMPAGGLAVLGRVAWPEDMQQNTLMAHIDGIGAQQFSYYYLQDGKEYDFRHFYTANISMKRNLLFSVDSWFDTDFIYPAFEDAELAFRLARHGLRIVYSAAPAGSHYHYHTIWTFAKRQYRAGLMACVFDRKHPGVLERTSVSITRHWRTFALLTRARLGLRSNAAASRESLEAAALHLASFYEWMPNRLLDRLYIGVLDFFWRKGVVDGMVGDSRRNRWIQNYLADRTLAPLLANFVQEARNEEIPLPEDLSLIGDRTLARLAA
jgi:GT2 family glycosyltransferase